MRLWSILEHLGASWGRLGAVLEVSWRRLGAFVERHGGALELLVDFLKASWKRPVGVSRSLEAVLRAISHPLLISK